MAPSFMVDMENLTFEFPSSSAKGPSHWSAKKWRHLAVQFEELKLKVTKENIQHWLTMENLEALGLEIGKKLVTNFYLRIVSSYVFSFLAILSILSWQNPIPWNVSSPVAAVLALFISIFFSISVTFRCVAVLSIPQFTTQQGRFVLLFVVSALMLGGPLVSLTYNTNQAAYSLTCMANMTARQGKALTDSYLEAYEEMAESINKTIVRIKHAKKTTDEKFMQFLNDMEAKVNELRTTIMGKEFECKSIMSGAREDCQYRSEAAYANCVDVTIGLKLNFLCEIVKIAPEICDNTLHHLCFPVAVVTDLTHEIDKLVDQMQEKFKFKLNIENNLNNIVNSSLNDTVIEESLQTAYQDAYEVIVSFVLTIKYILVGTICMVPFKSWMFLRRFLRLNRRKSSFLDRYPVLSERQRQREFMLQILMLLIHFILTLGVFMFDFVLYWIESAVEENGSISFATEGEIGFKFDVRLGDGLSINPFVDTQELFESMDMEMRGKHKFFTSTMNCLPKPVRPSGLAFIVPVFLLYIVTIVFLVAGNKFLKRRGDIIFYFFPNELYRHDANRDSSLIPF